MRSFAKVVRLAIKFMVRSTIRCSLPEIIICVYGAMLKSTFQQLANQIIADVYHREVVSVADAIQLFTVRILTRIYVIKEGVL